MLHLGTGILLCMAVGALGKGSKGGKSGGGGGDGGVLGLVIDVGSSWLSEHNNDASTVESTAATTDGTNVIYTPYSTAPYEPSTIPSVVSKASSVSPSAVTTPTGGVDLTHLFGPGERPDIWHLGEGNSSHYPYLLAQADVPVKNGINDNNNKTLTSIATVLLALTKLQSEGEWIKSLFDLPGDKGSVTEGPDVVNITLYNVGKDYFFDKHQVGSKQSMRIDRGNMKRLNELGVESSLIKDTEPWWPWALIEGVLEIESNFTDRNFTDTPGEEGEDQNEAVGYWLRLKVLTGNEASEYEQLYDLTDNPHDDLSVTMENAEISPVIFERQPDQWAVMMRGPHKNATGIEQYGWAGPFPTLDNKQVEEFNDYAPVTDHLGAKFIVYVDPPTAFAGRPENLRL